MPQIATNKIEELANELKKKFTVIIVTHNMQQGTRISDFTGFMYLGKQDDSIDELDHSIFRECITYMMEKPQTISRLTRYYGLSESRIVCRPYLQNC